MQILLALLAFRLTTTSAVVQHSSYTSQHSSYTSSSSVGSYASRSYGSYVSGSDTSASGHRSTASPSTFKYSSYSSYGHSDSPMTTSPNVYGSYGSYQTPNEKPKTEPTQAPATVDKFEVIETGWDINGFTKQTFTKQVQDAFVSAISKLLSLHINQVSIAEIVELTTESQQIAVDKRSGGRSLSTTMLRVITRISILKTDSQQLDSVRANIIQTKKDSAKFVTLFKQENGGKLPEGFSVSISTSPSDAKSPAPTAKIAPGPTKKEANVEGEQNKEAKIAEEESASKLSAGAIAGIILATISTIAIAAGFIYQKSRRPRNSSSLLPLDHDGGSNDVPNTNLAARKQSISSVVPTPQPKSTQQQNGSNVGVPQQNGSNAGANSSSPPASKTTPSKKTKKRASNSKQSGSPESSSSTKKTASKARQADSTDAKEFPSKKSTSKPKQTGSPGRISPSSSATSVGVANAKKEEVVETSTNNSDYSNQTDSERKAASAQSSQADAPPITANANVLPPLKLNSESEQQ